MKPSDPQEKDFCTKLERQSDAVEKCVVCYDNRCNNVDAELKRPSPYKYITVNRGQSKLEGYLTILIHCLVFIFK